MNLTAGAFVVSANPVDTGGSRFGRGGRRGHQREFAAALAGLEKPSLWRRINQAVNDAAARSRVSEDAKKRRKRVRCVRFRGTGRRLSDSGTYYRACECGGRDLGYHPGDPEVELAAREAARLRGEIH